LVANSHWLIYDASERDFLDYVVCSALDRVSSFIGT